MTCPACEHPARNDIDIRMAQGDSLARLRLMFALPDAVLKLHKQEHLRNLPIKLQTDPSSPLRDLERVEDDAWTVVQLAKGQQSIGNPDEWIVKPNPGLHLLALAEIRRTKETQVKLAKELAMFSKNTVPRETYEKLVAAVVKALEPFPEARRAVEEIVAELEL